MYGGDKDDSKIYYWNIDGYSRSVSALSNGKEGLIVGGISENFRLNRVLAIDSGVACGLVVDEAEDLGGDVFNVYR